MSLSFGVVGLGRMGGNLALQAINKGMKVIGYDPKGAGEELTRAGIELSPTLAGLVAGLAAPRVVLVYVPSGRVVDDVIEAVAAELEPGDIVVDGGNSYWGDSIRRHRRLAESGIRFVDCGTSGGVDGARNGACFMAGGDEDAVREVERVLRPLAVEGGWVSAGPPGAGHFVKLVHNGIEFGMLQAIAEGVDLLEHWGAPLPIADVLHAWNHGSVIRSWLVELMEQGYRAEGGAQAPPGFVDDTGEVNWLVADALHLERAVPVISTAVMQLLLSRDDERIWAKAIAIMRKGFGGHPYGRDAFAQRERKTGRVGEYWTGPPVEQE